MSDVSDVENAIGILSRMQSAAPPVAAARLSEVITVLRTMQDEHKALSEEVARLRDEVARQTGGGANPANASDIQTDWHDDLPSRLAPPIFDDEELPPPDYSSDLFANLVWHPEVEAGDDSAPVSVETTTGTDPLDFEQQFRAILSERVRFDEGDEGDDISPSDLDELLEASSPGAAPMSLSGLLGTDRVGTSRYLTDDDEMLTDADTTADRIPTAELKPRETLAIPSSEELLERGIELLKPALITLRGQADAMATGQLGRLPANQVEALRQMQNRADGMLALVEALEMLYRLRTKTYKLEFDAFQAADLIHAAHAAIAGRAGMRELTLNVRADLDLPPVYGDYAAALAILTDLLDNAIRYTPAGGTITLSADSLGTHVLFTVNDTGIGLSPEDTAQVGQPFWRAVHQPLVRAHSGTGLRLFIARLLLSAIGGELIFSGDPGLGSSFSFTLPVTA